MTTQSSDADTPDDDDVEMKLHGKFRSTDGPEITLEQFTIGLAPAIVCTFDIEADPPTLTMNVTAIDFAPPEASEMLRQIADAIDESYAKHQAGES